MKKNITLLVFLSLAFFIDAQIRPETEPNNSFAQANFIKYDSTRSGANVSPSDISDYYYVILPEDGTVKLSISGNNTGGGNGYLYLYVFDGRAGNGQIVAKYVGNNNSVPSGNPVSEALSIYGRAADTMYFRLDASGSFAYSISYTLVDTSPNDTEPNNTFAQSIPINELQQKVGHINYYKKGGSDQFDYYRMVLPKDGTVKLYVEGTNLNGGNCYMYIYGYDGRMGNGQILAKYIANNNSVNHGTKIADTIRLYGRNADTMYVRIDASGAFKYSFKYEMVDTSLEDTEPNNAFNESIPINELQEKVGHIGYVKRGGPDGNDYYKAVLPINGTLKIMVSGTNLNGGNGYLYIYTYDGRAGNGQILAKYIAGNNSVPHNASVVDTIYLYGRAIDTTYFRIHSSGAFKYSIKYEMVDTNMNDIEPNDLFSQALQMNEHQEKVGNVRYSRNGILDPYDYYRVVLPKDGTLKIYVRGTNYNGGNGYLYIYAYDGRMGNGQILAKYIANKNNVPFGATVLDTIYLYGRAADTSYFRVDGSGAFKYSIKYEVTDTSTNDKEFNNTFKTAIPIAELEQKKGHSNYVTRGGPDNIDYYRTLLPRDGTVKIYVNGTNMNGGNGYMYIYGYDGRAGNGQILAKYVSGKNSVGAGKSITDTILLFGRAVDTMYFRIESAGAFKYDIRYEVVDTSTNDKEPNGTFADGLFLNPLQLGKGHVGYSANGGRDNYDYYKVALQTDGTARIFLQGTNKGGGSGYLYLYVYDGRKGNGQIFSKYIANMNSVPHSQSITDTINLFCRAKDTLFFRLESSVAFSYHFSYAMANVSVNDAEPNDNFATPVNAPIGVKKEGHIGYSAAGGSDNDDYYRTVMPAGGSVKLMMEVTNTSPGNGYVYIYGYDKRKGNGQILAKYVKNTSSLISGKTYRDTIFLNCFNSDTFYLRVTSSGCFRYSLITDFVDRRPVANTENERIGNTVGFRPQFSNADKFIWDFGDATTSTLKYPMKTFKIGYFVTRLIVTNSICGFKDTAEEIFEVKGVEYYTPDSAGSGGDAIIKIFGAGLDTGTRVTLTQGSLEIKPVRKFTTKNFVQLNAIFDLHLIPEGLYDLTIEIAGQNPIVYKNGFKVNKFRYPYTWAEVVAPSRWRTNVDNKFKLVVGNTGNVNASGVLVAFIWPKAVDLKFDTKWFKPPASGNYTIATKDTTFNFKWENIRHFYNDTFNTITSIDTFNGRPYNGYMRLILIPKIGPGSTYEIPLIAKSSSVGAQNFIAFTYKPNLFGSCPNGSWMDASENMAVEAVDLLDRGVSAVPVLDKSPVSWLVKATKGTTTHMANLGQAMGAFYNYLDGTTTSIDASLPADYYQNVDAGNAQVTGAIIDVAVDKMVEKGADGIMKGQSDNLSNYLAKNPNATKSSLDFAKSNLKDINDIRQAIKDGYKDYKDIKDLGDKLARLEQLVKDCPELKPQLDELKKLLDKDMNLKDPKETKTNSVTSMDPNAIYGPVGQGSGNQFLNKIDRQNYLITFENVDTALAAAQIVQVLDTLDKTRFDMRTFEFGNYTIGTRTFEVPSGRKQFVQEDSLSPLMRVRVNGQLDTAKGIITWQFTAIDPATGDIPVFEGFLNPNISKPEGEGGVSYTIQPWSSLKDATVLTNRASIVFDNNPAIATNTWTNVIDRLPPVSSVNANFVPGKTLIRLTFNGTDAASGVGYYNLYVKVNGGAWMAFGGSATDTLLIQGEYGVKYSFCAIASDLVGNLENKTLVEEATVGVERIEEEMPKLSLRPNPAGSMVSIDGSTGDETYQVTDISGRVILSGTLDDTQQIEVSALKTGLYIITVEGKYTQSLKLVKM